MYDSIVSNYSIRGWFGYAGGRVLDRLFFHVHLHDRRTLERMLGCPEIAQGWGEGDTQVPIPWKDRQTVTTLVRCN